jgi:hypothetical protein
VPANVSTQFKETGNVSFTAVGAVIGRRFVRFASGAARTGGPGLSTDLKNQYRFRQAAVGGEVLTGVAKYDVADTKSGGVHGQAGQIVELEAGAAFAVGAKLTTDSVGRAVAVTDAAGADEFVGAIAFGAAANAGDIVEAKLVLA